MPSAAASARDRACGDSAAGAAGEHREEIPRVRRQKRARHAGGAREDTDHRWLRAVQVVREQIRGHPLGVDVELDRADDACRQQRVGQGADGQVLAADPDQPAVGGDPERRARGVGDAAERRTPAQLAAAVGGDSAVVDQQRQVLADRGDRPPWRRELDLPAPMSVVPSV